MARTTSLVSHLVHLIGQCVCAPSVRIFKSNIQNVSICAWVISAARLTPTCTRTWQASREKKLTDCVTSIPCTHTCAPSTLALGSRFLYSSAFHFLKFLYFIIFYYSPKALLWFFCLRISVFFFFFVGFDRWAALEGWPCSHPAVDSCK